MVAGGVESVVVAVFKGFVVEGGWDGVSGDTGCMVSGAKGRGWGEGWVGGKSVGCGRREGGQRLGVGLGECGWGWDKARSENGCVLSGGVAGVLGVLDTGCGDREDGGPAYTIHEKGGVGGWGSGWWIIAYLWMWTNGPGVERVDRGGLLGDWSKDDRCYSVLWWCVVGGCGYVGRFDIVIGGCGGVGRVCALVEYFGRWGDEEWGSRDVIFMRFYVAKCAWMNRGGKVGEGRVWLILSIAIVGGLIWVVACCWISRGSVVLNGNVSLLVYSVSVGVDVRRVLGGSAVVGRGWLLDRGWGLGDTSWTVGSRVQGWQEGGGRLGCCEWGGGVKGGGCEGWLVGVESGGGYAEEGALGGGGVLRGGGVVWGGASRVKRAGLDARDGGGGEQRWVGERLEGLIEGFRGRMRREAEGLEGKICTKLGWTSLLWDSGGEVFYVFDIFRGCGWGGGEGVAAGSMKGEK
ncbi:hypothetical protein Tco_0862679 [Tanacetum coccineum]